MSAHLPDRAVRANSPGLDTAEITRRIVDPYVGLVARVTTTPPPAGAPNFFTSRATMSDYTRWIARKRVHGLAAELTADDAMTAAVFEAAERYALTDPGGIALRLAAHRDLKRHADVVPALHLKALQPLDPEAAGLKRFSEDTPIEWVEGRSLHDGRRVYVPADLVILRPSTLFEGTTTGAASGVSVEEALLGGILEVIERDAFMLTWMARRVPAIIDVSQDHAARMLCEQLRSDALKIRFFAITADVSVPVVLACVVREEGEVPYPSFGASAKPDWASAIEKAALEAHGCLLIAEGANLAGGSEVTKDSIASFGDHVRYYLQRDRRTEWAFLFEGETITVPTTGDSRRAAAAHHLSNILRLLSERSIDAIAVDVTPDDLGEVGVVVVKVLCPGMIDLNVRHPCRPVRQERLYRVPASLKWTNPPTNPCELNPDPHPFP